jgi:hypothetical protein
VSPAAEGEDGRADDGQDGARNGRPWRHMVWATPLVAALALLPGGRFLLPLLAPLTVYPAFARRVGGGTAGGTAGGDYFGAWRLGLLWAALLSAAVIALAALAPGAAAGGVLHGEPYRREMFGWIATGQAPENDWRQFLPQHALHLGLFLLLTWASGGYLGLVLGAALVGYMSWFVGSYARVVTESAGPLAGALAALAAWVPWSVLRVLAFVLLGSLFARPLLVRRPWPFGSEEHRLMLLAVSGLAADILIKTFLAPGYGRFLRQMAGGAVAALYSGPLVAPGIL